VAGFRDAHVGTAALGCPFERNSTTVPIHNSVIPKWRNLLLFVWSGHSCPLPLTSLLTLTLTLPLTLMLPLLRTEETFSPPGT
jgi:hypothetical protein